jgi:hypothetical protein
MLPDQLSHNAYITDGHRLFRCLEAPEDGEVMLEDCLNLELALFHVADLAEANARLVKPSRPLVADVERPIARAVAS